ncbi:hypothetical protein [Sunxiuqinia indica]|uniref:hypothetical protein n=1 Tax=Sunxiuqinia indica TaxID=2692584 RepID=UPI001357C228|nr:hypothetical protein [Sunxiuqinia indica]
MRCIQMGQLSPQLRRKVKRRWPVKVARASEGGKDFWRVSGVVHRKEKILTRLEG